MSTNKQLVAAAALILSLLYLNCGTPPEKKQEMSHDDMVKRGAYLVNLGGCNDCHSPKVMTDRGPVPDEKRLLSGHPSAMSISKFDTNAVKPGMWFLASNDLTAWVGPWGISYTANLTPDGPTGIGNWTEEIFIKSLRTGKHMGFGRAILPPMPWEPIGKSTDEDLKAIFAYLKSLPPVRNTVPDPVPPHMVSSFIAMQQKAKIGFAVDKQ